MGWSLRGGADGGARISQHQYSAAFCSGGDFDLISFMNKTSIRGNLTVFEEDIAATHANGLDYILGFVNSFTPMTEKVYADVPEQRDEQYRV